MSLLLALLPLASLPPACAHGVLQVQLAPAVALHLLLKLAELMLHLAEDIILVLQLLPELKLLPVPKLYLTLEVLYLCRVF